MKVKILETNKQIKGELIQGSVNGVDFKYVIGSGCEINEDLYRVLVEAGYEVEEIAQEEIEEGSAE